MRASWQEPIPWFPGCSSGSSWIALLRGSCGMPCAAPARLARDGPQRPLEGLLKPSERPLRPSGLLWVHVHVIAAAHPVVANDPLVAFCAGFRPDADHLPAQGIPARGCRRIPAAPLDAGEPCPFGANTDLLEGLTFAGGAAPQGGQVSGHRVEGVLEHLSSYLSCEVRCPLTCLYHGTGQPVKLFEKLPCPAAQNVAPVAFAILPSIVGPISSLGPKEKTKGAIPGFVSFW